MKDLASKKSGTFVGAGLLWLCVVAGAMRWWMIYDRTPGVSHPSPIDWPKGSQMSPDAEAGTLVMFVHPHCPCTRAGLRKLETALADCARRPTSYVVLTTVDGEPDDAPSANRRLAESIPNVRVLTDRDQLEVQRFGAATSGWTAYYDARGRLQFAGGLTAERGGEELSAYERLLREALDGSSGPVATTPVFGCPL